MRYEIVYCNPCNGYDVSFETDSLKEAKKVLATHKEKASIHDKQEDKVVETNDIKEFMFMRCN